MLQVRQSFPFLIPSSFQKWLLQKLPKHPPNKLHPSSTMAKPLFTRSFTFSFKLGLPSSCSTWGQGVGPVPVHSCLLQSKLNWAPPVRLFWTLVTVQGKVTVRGNKLYISREGYPPTSARPYTPSHELVHTHAQMWRETISSIGHTKATSSIMWVILGVIRHPSHLDPSFPPTFSLHPKPNSALTECRSSCL